MVENGTEFLKTTTTVIGSNDAEFGNFMALDRFFLSITAKTVKPRIITLQTVQGRRRFG